MRETSDGGVIAPGVGNRQSHINTLQPQGRTLLSVDILLAAVGNIVCANSVGCGYFEAGAVH